MQTEEKKPRSLVQKINDVMGELGAVEKTGKNEFQNYKYMAHAELMKQIHPLLIKHGLVIYPSSALINSCTGVDVTNGTKVTRQNRIAIEVAYIITDGVDKIQFCGIGEGVDSQDKSAYKAQTGAHKYALKGLFCIPDELDAEDDAHEQAEDKFANGAKPNANSTQKAGAERANEIKLYLETMHLMAGEVNKALKDTKAASVRELPKNVADDLINLAKDREIMQNDAKKGGK